MSTAEIKNYLHEFIVETNDADVLTEIKAYFKQLTAKKSDWWDELTEKQQESVNIGLNQLEKGEGIPHNVVRAKIDKLLQKNG